VVRDRISTRLLSWASILENNTREQAERTASMRFIFPHLAYSAEKIAPNHAVPAAGSAHKASWRISGLVPRPLPAMIVGQRSWCAAGPTASVRRWMQDSKMSSSPRAGPAVVSAAVRFG
jgi:hypothetical protein